MSSGSLRITPKKGGRMLEWLSQGRSNILVVSFFTDRFYLREAFELARTCQQTGLDFCISQVPDSQSWIGNTNLKPSFLQVMDERFPTRPLLWLDADARVRKYPILLEGVDLPICVHTWRGRGLASGTVFLPPHPVRKTLLLKWRQEVQKSPEATDQVCLDRAIRALQLHRGELPVEYCWIFDNTQCRKGEPDPQRGSPVIEHMQASRWTRKDLLPGRKQDGSEEDDQAVDSTLPPEQGDRP